MLKITLPAFYIPEGTQVTRPTGTKPYTILHDGLKIFTESGSEVHYRGCCVLQSENSINIISPEVELAVHFHDAESAVNFLQNLTTMVKGK